MTGNPDSTPGSENFCSGYSAVADIEQLVSESDEDFFVRYRIWQEQGSPGGPAMVTFFGGTSESSRALELGHVLSGDCAKFNDFVANAGPRAAASVDALGDQVTRASDPARTLFEAAIVKLFVTQDPLTDWEKGALNGTLIVQANLSTTAIGSGADKRTYGVPGFVIVPWMREANKGLWNVVDGIIEEAFAATATRMVNVTGVVQIRIGDESQPIFERVTVAPGFTMRGGV